MTAISLLVVGFVSLYNNSETFRNAINKLGNGIKTVFTAVKDAVVSLKDKFISAFETIRKKVSSIVEKIKGFLQPLVDLFNKVKDGVASIGGKIKGFFVGDASGHATGTPYFPGGPTRINEGGRGEIVDLPNGTRIIPHDVAKKSQGGTSIVVHVTVQGNVIGNRPVYGTDGRVYRQENYGCAGGCVMDFILSYNNNEMVMPFPVVPNGGISLTRAQDNITFDGVNYELQAIGTMNLASFELSSIFPNRPYPWLRPGSVADGWAYVRTIEAARLRRIPFRAIHLDNDGTELFNLPVTVESFEYGRDQAGDVAYTLSCKEYRFAIPVDLEELAKPADARGRQPRRNHSGRKIRGPLPRAAIKRSTTAMTL